MNSHLVWTMRIALLLVPVSMLFAWQYGVRMDSMAARISYMSIEDSETQWIRNALQERFEEASESASFWDSILHLSVGAVAGTSVFAVARRPKLIAHAFGLKGMLARTTVARRRFHLLTIRHRVFYGVAYLGAGIALDAIIVEVLRWMSSGAYTSRPWLLEWLEPFICVGLFIASTVLILRSVSLLRRVSTLFGIIRLFLTLLILAVHIMGWGIIGIYALFWLSDATIM